MVLQEHQDSEGNMIEGQAASQGRDVPDGERPALSEVPGGPVQVSELTAAFTYRACDKKAGKSAGHGEQVWPALMQKSSFE